MRRPRSWRREDGQSGAEYLGALLSSARSSSSCSRRRAGRDRRGVRQAICTIGSGTDCGEPDRRRRLRRRRALSRTPAWPTAGSTRPAAATTRTTPSARATTRRRRRAGRQAYANLGRVYDCYHSPSATTPTRRGAPVVGRPSATAAVLLWRRRVHFAPAAGDAPEPPPTVHPSVPRRRRRCDYECQSGALNEPITDTGLEPRPRGPDLRRGPRRRRPGRPRRRHEIRDYRYPEPLRQPMTVDDYRATAQRPLRRLGRRAHQQRHPQPRLLPARRPRRPREGRADRLARARPSTSPPDSDFEDFRTAMLAVRRGALRPRRRRPRRRCRGVRRRRPRRHLARARAGRMLSDGAPARRSVGMTMRPLPPARGSALLAAAGCGEDDAGLGRHSPLSETIKYEVIGGDAFRDDKLTVHADGSAQRPDARPATRAGQAHRRRAAALSARTSRPRTWPRSASAGTDRRRPTRSPTASPTAAARSRPTRARCRTSCAP